MSSAGCISGLRHRILAAALAALPGLAGCAQDMARQPKAKPLAPSDFFADGRSQRPLVENTVPRGALANDALTSAKDSNEFAVPVTRELLERGRERYNIYCSPCHGLQGDGNGMIAERGFRHPPTFHDDRLRQSPTGHFYDVITSGFGIMPDYAAQVPPRDRWAIIGYVRALQYSRQAPAGELPPDLRKRLSEPNSPAGTVERSAGAER